MRRLIQEELNQATKTLTAFSQQESSFVSIEKAAIRMTQAIVEKKKIITCGNGGSHCDAMHFAEELTGKYRTNRRALPALCISDVAHLSCVGNDYGYEFVFSRYLEGLGQEGDILLAISTSGNSPNILHAARVAKEKKMTVIALSGADGGNLAVLSDILIKVPHHGFPDRIQEMHIKIVHILILLIEKTID